MSENSTETKTYPRSVGGIWKYDNTDGSVTLSVQVELNGQKYNFKGYNNRFKESGDNRPNYQLFVAEDKGATTKPAAKTTVAAKPAVVAAPARKTRSVPAPVVEQQVEEQVAAEESPL